jgi:hypothetical protein
VVGFAILSAKITRLEKQISTFDERLVDLRNSIEALRQDRINDDLSWLRTTLQQMEESWTLRTPNAQLERVANDSHIVANRFFDRAKAVLASSGPRIQNAAPFLEAVGLAQSARVAARLAADENDAARGAAIEALDQYDELLDEMDAADDALRSTPDEVSTSDDTAWAARLGTAMESARATSTGVRMRAEAMAASDEMLATLSKRGVGGREFLSAARDEGDVPFLVLAAA